MTALWRRLPRGRRAVGHILAIGVSAAVVVLLIRQLASDWTALSDRQMRDALHLDLAPLVAAWLVQTAGFLLLVDTWRQILGGPGRHLRFVRHLRTYAYTSLAHIIPGTIWSPASRVALYRADGVPGLTVTAALLVEWLLVGLGGLMLYGLFAPWSHARPPEGAWLLVLVAVAALVLLHPRAFGRTIQFASSRLGGTEPDTLHLPGPRRLTVWFGRELVVMALSGVALYFLMQAVSPTASLPDAMAAWGLSMAVSNLLVWLPATSLLKDAGVVLLLTPLYGSSVIALGVVIAWRVWMVVVQLSWAGLVTLAGRTWPQGSEDRADGESDVT